MGEFPRKADGRRIFAPEFKELLQREALPPVMKPASVLLLDGNPSSREALERAIEQAGHTALVARTGPEALALVSNLRPPVALVDLDGSGEEAFSVLRDITLGRTDTVAFAVSGVSDT